jgi:hypothetical protein
LGCEGTLTGVGGEGYEPPPTSGTAAPGDATADMPVEAPLRRLTRAQYDNTVRDLLGIDSNPAQDFGHDEEGGGFASNYRAAVEPLQVEHYQRAAEALAEQALQNLTAIAPCAPPQGTEAACLDEFLRDFGTRAYRRPLTAAETESYEQLFATGKGDSGDFASGLSLVISTMLQSPHFLYRIELGDSTAAEKDALPLTSFELASRLSYFLQNTMPDKELLVAAQANELQTPEQIAEQARRLLENPNARDTFRSFHEQWVEVTALATLEKNADTYPEFGADLRTALQDEFRAFVDYVMLEGDARLETLLTADFTFASAPLYDLYGLDAPDGATADTLTRVTLPAGQRAGLFTLASVMAVHSHPDQTSPVIRGYIISDKLLCDLPPPPPPNLEIEIPELDPNLPTRERFEQHRADPTCSACHQKMDPIGFAFEHYDAIGRYRTMDAGSQVDASSEVVGTDQDGPVQDAVEMMSRLAQASEVRSCLATHWFRYAFGRPDKLGDAGTIAAALKGFAASDYRIPELLVALTTTKGFRYRLPIKLQ